MRTINCIGLLNDSHSMIQHLHGSTNLTRAKESGDLSLHCSSLLS